MIKKQIPNSLTLLNLLCGLIAIKYAVYGHLQIATGLMMASLFFDFFDGFAARALKVSSPIGKDLDSLADMVTFGVLPGFFMYHLIGQAVQNEGQLTGYLPLAGFLIPLLSAVRLAKFNNDTRQSDRFIGLPTPANSIFICSIGWIWQNNPSSVEWLMQPLLLLALTILMSLLLVSEIRLLALKFKHFRFRGNEFRYILVAASAVLLVFFKMFAPPVIIVFYILLSIVDNIFSNNTVK